MKQETVNGVQVFFEEDDRDAAQMIGKICGEAEGAVSKYWALPIPKQYRVYVLTSVTRFRLHAAPWMYQFLLLVFFPLWYGKVKRISTLCAGLTERYRMRPAIGIKPPRLLDHLNKTVGEKIMIREPDMTKKLRGIASHEMTHALAVHLYLPLWLNEGIALLSSEHFLGKRVVKAETVGLLANQTTKKRPESYTKITSLGHDTLAYQYIRGYWVTRYLLEGHRELLAGLLKRRMSHSDIEGAIAKELGLKRRHLWRDIDALVTERFLQPPPI